MDLYNVLNLFFLGRICILYCHLLLHRFAKKRRKLFVFFLNNCMKLGPRFFFFIYLYVFTQECLVHGFSALTLLIFRARLFCVVASVLYTVG